MNWGLLHCKQILYQLSYEGTPIRGIRIIYVKHPDTKTESHRLKVISLITNKRESKKKERRKEGGRKGGWKRKKEKKRAKRKEGAKKKGRKREGGGEGGRERGRLKREQRKGRSTFVQVTHYWAGLLFILEQKEKKNKSTTDVPRIIFPISSLKINFVF